VGAALAFAATANSAALADQTRNHEWWLQALHVTQAWESSRGTGITVAVLDTGVDPNQPDLAGSVITGPDFTGSGRTPGHPFWGVHGTAVASLIAGHGHGTGNGSGIIGIAPAAKILSVRVTLEANDPALADPAFAAGLPGAIAHGIRYAVRHGAKVIDLPLDPVTAAGAAGSGGSKPEAAAISSALRRGVVLVAPAGDNGTGSDAVNYPAAYPGVISVGAFDDHFVKAAFSNRGRYVTLTAAGVGVTAAGVSSRGGYTTLNSTSAASAMVAGVAALIRSQFPELTPAQVTRLLTHSTVFHRPGGRRNGSGFGTVDAAAALLAAAHLAETVPGTPASPGVTPPAAPVVSPSPVHTSLTHKVTVYAAIGAAAFLVILGLVAGFRGGRRRRARSARLAEVREAARVPVGRAAGPAAPTDPGSGFMPAPPDSVASGLNAPGAAAPGLVPAGPMAAGASMSGFGVPGGAASMRVTGGLSQPPGRMPGVPSLPGPLPGSAPGMLAAPGGAAGGFAAAGGLPGGLPQAGGAPGGLSPTASAAGGLPRGGGPLPGEPLPSGPAPAGMGQPASPLPHRLPHAGAARLGPPAGVGGGDRLGPPRGRGGSPAAFPDSAFPEGSFTDGALTDGAFAGGAAPAGGFPGGTFADPATPPAGPAGPAAGHGARSFGSHRMGTVRRPDVAGSPPWDPAPRPDSELPWNQAPAPHAAGVRPSPQRLPSAGSPPTWDEVAEEVWPGGPRTAEPSPAASPPASRGPSGPAGHRAGGAPSSQPGQRERPIYVWDAEPEPAPRARSPRSTPTVTPRNSPPWESGSRPGAPAQDDAAAGPPWEVRPVGSEPWLTERNAGVTPPWDDGEPSSESTDVIPAVPAGGDFPAPPSGGDLHRPAPGGEFGGPVPGGAFGGPGQGGDFGGPGQGGDFGGPGLGGGVGGATAGGGTEGARPGAAASQGGKPPPGGRTPLPVRVPRRITSASAGGSSLFGDSPRAPAAPPGPLSSPGPAAGEGDAFSGLSFGHTGRFRSSLPGDSTETFPAVPRDDPGTPEER
jgi:type VII secretion-associated serine protease mycosin